MPDSSVGVWSAKKAHEEQAEFTVSTAAIEHIKKTVAKRGHGNGLRVSLEKKGCSGLRYVVKFVDQHEPNDPAISIGENLTVSIEQKSYPFLRGIHIDYVRENLSEGFKFTNPNEKGTCGCGESFNV